MLQDTEFKFLDEAIYLSACLLNYSAPISILPLKYSSCLSKNFFPYFGEKKRMGSEVGEVYRSQG
jgi:hypothetical protein